MPTPQSSGLRLTRDTIEHQLSTMTIEQGRRAYLAYGNLRDTLQILRVLAHCHGASETALAHAITTVRRGAAEIGRIPMSRALSRGSAIAIAAS